MSKDLAVPATAQLARAVSKVYEKAVRAAERACAQPGDADFDPALNIPWKDAPIWVRAGVMIAAKAADHVRERDVSAHNAALMVLTGRMKNARQWEERAAEVDSEAKKTVIDVAPAEEPPK